MAMTDYAEMSRPKRDYSLVGASSRSAVETGLASAEWYHTDVPRKTMKALMQRSDAPAIRDTLLAVRAGRAPTVDTHGRPSAVWGQPRLSAWMRWKRAARRDRARGVPVAFATGYDAAAIPERFSGVARFEKPVALARIAQAIGRAIRADA